MKKSVFQNKKVAAALLAAAIVVLFGGGYLLYSSLSGSYAAASESHSASESRSASGSESAMTDSQLAQSASGASSDSTSSSDSVAAPDFTIYDKDGNTVTLASFAGKPVVLNFWASWCGPCKNEMPHLQAAYEKYGDQINFVMLDLNGGGNDTQEAALTVVNNSGYTFPVYFDTDLSAAYAYGVRYTPTTYAISADGKVVNYAIGQMDEATLQQLIDGLLG